MRSLALLAFPVLAATLAIPQAVKASEAATVRKNRDGDQLFVDALQAKVSQTVLSPPQITTQNSRGQLEFQSRAAARLNRFTQLRLGKRCLLRAKGQVLVSGKQSGCTKSLGLSSPGTNDLISLKDDDPTDVNMLEGSVGVETLTSTEQPAEQADLLSDLLAEINVFRRLAGNPTFPAVPQPVQNAINPYGLILINAMRRTGGCFHGGSNGVPSPFDVVQLPVGWSVLGEVLGCPAEPGVWDPKIVARMLWESPTHRRIVFDSKKALAICCVWSKAGHRGDTEAMVCLTLRSEKSKTIAVAPLLITAGFRFRFSDVGKVRSFLKLRPDDYNAILRGPMFTGFAPRVPKLDALKHYITDKIEDVA